LSSSRRSATTVGIVIAVLVALAGVAALVFVLFVRSPAPPAVGLGSPSPGASAAAPSVGAVPSGATSSLDPANLSGTWTIDPSIGSFSDFSSSFVGYRVDETLAGNEANIAVGRTPDVSGTLVLDGASITSVEVTANLVALQSDDERRDGQLRRQALETEAFPQATFRLTSPIELGAEPVDGATIAATATGELTLHGVTRTVQIPIEARLSGDVVTVAGSIDIVFADYNIAQPMSFLVLSIEDHGTMELQLYFRRG
jgi:polyisoprenoid-binding protein YceI